MTRQLLRQRKKKKLLKRKPEMREEKRKMPLNNWLMLCSHSLMPQVQKITLQITKHTREHLKVSISSRKSSMLDMLRSTRRMQLLKPISQPLLVKLTPS